MNCLVENAAMMHLAHKQVLKIAVSGAEAEAFVRLPQPNLTTLAADAVAEHLGRFDHAEKSYWLAPVSGRCKGFGAGVRNRPKRLRSIDTLACEMAAAENNVGGRSGLGDGRIRGGRMGRRGPCPLPGGMMRRFMIKKRMSP